MRSKTNNKEENTEFMSDENSLKMLKEENRAKMFSLTCVVIFFVLLVIGLDISIKGCNQNVNTSRCRDFCETSKESDGYKLVEGECICAKSN